MDTEKTQETKMLDTMIIKTMKQVCNFTKRNTLFLMFLHFAGVKKKVSKGKKPEWQNVYGKASQPADGAVNAFQWSD